MGEISLGIVNRGTVTIDDSQIRDVGNLLLYPILAQIKIYPYAAGSWHAQPYLTAGAGLYLGRRDVQFTDSNFLFAGSNQETASKLSYVLGGGIDWPIGNVISLGLDGKYMPINYSKGFVTVNNYNAVVITVGVKYLIARKK
jgi:opacity protein-like surface antigen